ncbi:MAG: hypothetical protein BWY59_01532 [Verrucomicrobia bacterium ADurb.Bin345]|nr:MAG: hypothetical protein BWY59_01532 [Verrucomicrobia bacterium ADurb.Bin345]
MVTVGASSESGSNDRTRLPPVALRMKDPPPLSAAQYVSSSTNPLVEVMPPTMIAQLFACVLSQLESSVLST